MGYYDDMDTSNMDSPDWQDTASPTSAPDYANSQLDSPDMSNWDTSDFNFSSNLVNSAPQEWAQQSPLQLTTAEQGAAGNIPTSTNWNPNSSTTNFLQQLFSGTQGKMLSTGLGALLTGQQNKQKAAAYNNLANTLKTGADPFGSQRGFYQTQLQNSVTDPYSSPIVSAQVNQLQRAQAIKDAAAGRRSNSATSNPATLAAMAQVAQNYMNSLQTPAGANISPNYSGYASAAGQAINSGVNGYTSPLANALGYSQQTSNNSDQLLQALAKALSGGK